MRHFGFLFILCGLLLTARPLLAQTTGPADTSTPTAADVLYEDPSANSSVTVTQILPNSSTTMMTFGAVKRIRVRQDILIIEWGTTATTLLPRQFVGTLTVNKRSGPEK